MEVILGILKQVVWLGLDEDCRESWEWKKKMAG